MPASMPRSLLGTVLVAVLAHSPAHAASFQVTSPADAGDTSPGDGICAAVSGACTLRAAIEEANALGGRDAISVPAGSYDFTASALAISEEVDVGGAGRDATVLQGSIVFSHGPSASASLSDARVIGSIAPDGAGVNMELTRVAVQGGVTCYGYCLIRHSEVTDGTGVLVLGSTLGVVEDSQMLRSSGPGIQIGIGGWTGGFQIRRSRIAHNAGPGIRADESDGTIDDTVIEENGGPGYFSNSDGGVTIRRSTLRGNQGGGYACSNGYGNYDFVDLFESAIVGNVATTGGGGIWCLGQVGVPSGVRIYRSTISGNVGATAGGIHTTNLTLEDSTIADNAGGDVGGLLLEGQVLGPFVLDPVAVLQRPLIADNEGPDAPDCAAVVGETGSFTGAGNLIGDGTGCSFASGIALLVGDATNPIDPLLAPLDEANGATPSHALLPGSPALDVIPIATCAAAPPFPTDQLGVARPQGGGCDIGAIEVTACRNGIDDDGDGAVDFPSDLGCRAITATKESPQCSDGIDNDGDGKVDWDGAAGATPDPDCADKPWRDKERPDSACGLGAELVALGAWLRRRRR
jgi:CSLREA domain-containing protein